MSKQASHIRVGCVFMRKELSKLSEHAQLAYFWLLSYCNGDQNGICYPSQETLAAHMQVSRRTVIRAIAEIESAGLIQRKPQLRNTRERYQCVEYFVRRSI